MMMTIKIQVYFRWKSLKFMNINILKIKRIKNKGKVKKLSKTVKWKKTLIC